MLKRVWVVERRRREGCRRGGCRRVRRSWLCRVERQVVQRDGVAMVGSVLEGWALVQWLRD